MGGGIGIKQVFIQGLLRNGQLLRIAEILHQKQLVLQIGTLKGDLRLADDLRGEQIAPDIAVEHRLRQPVSQQRVHDPLPDSLPVIDPLRQQQLRAARSVR